MPKPQVFMCHSSSDKAFVRRLAADLQAQGVTVWFDEWEIRVGDSIQDKINAGIKDAAWLIVVLSQRSIHSPWVKRELSAGFVRELDEKRVVVLPILLEQCDIPPLLKDKRYADFSGPYDKGLLDLISAILPDRERIAISLEKLLLPAVAVDMPGLRAVNWRA